MVVIRSVCEDDAKPIAAMMREVQSALPDPSMYVISDAPRVRRKLKTTCFGWVAEDEKGVAAFYLFQQPGYDNKEENLGFDLGLDARALRHVLVLDTVAVRPDCRRRGLASKLLALGEARGVELGCTWYLATVDPRNEANLGCLERAGYSVAKHIEGYSSADEHYVLHDSGVGHASHPVSRLLLVKHVKEAT